MSQKVITMERAIRKLRIAQEETRGALDLLNGIQAGIHYGNGEQIVRLIRDKIDDVTVYLNAEKKSPT